MSFSERAPTGLEEGHTGVLATVQPEPTTVSTVLITQLNSYLALHLPFL